MFLPPTALSLALWLSLLAPVATQHCKLIRARDRSDQQPLDPNVPSPGPSLPGGVSPTGASSTSPQPSSTAFVYGQDKIRGVNVCVAPSFPAFLPVPDLPASPLEVAGSC